MESDNQIRLVQRVSMMALIAANGDIDHATEIIVEYGDKARSAKDSENPSGSSVNQPCPPNQSSKLNTGQP